MSDTRPSELAEIVKSEEAFRLYVVQKLERADGQMQAHIAEDKRNFLDVQETILELKNSLQPVSSSVSGLEKDAAKEEGAKAAIYKIAAVGAFVITTFIALYGAFK